MVKRKISEDFACPGCQEQFDLETHLPLVGSCGHSLCGVCVSEKKPEACPACHKIGSFATAPRNELAIEFLSATAESDVKDSMKPKMTGGEYACDEPIPAILDPDITTCPLCNTEGVFAMKKKNDIAAAIDWSGLIEFVKDFHPRDVTIHGTDYYLPIDASTYFLQKKEIKLSCYARVADCNILRSPLRVLYLPNSPISKETFESLVLRFAHSTEEISWNLGCQKFHFNPSTLFEEVLPFDHEGRVSEKRPLAFFKENEPNYFYVLRKDGKVLHCYQFERPVRISFSLLNPSAYPPCLKNVASTAVSCSGCTVNFNCEAHVRLIGSCGHSLCSSCASESETCPVCQEPGDFLKKEKRSEDKDTLANPAEKEAKKPKLEEPAEEPKDALPAILDPKNAEVLVASTTVLCLGSSLDPDSFCVNSKDIEIINDDSKDIEIINYDSKDVEITQTVDIGHSGNKSCQEKELSAILAQTDVQPTLEPAEEPKEEFRDGNVCVPSCPGTKSPPEETKNFFQRESCDQPILQASSVTVLETESIPEATLKRLASTVSCPGCTASFDVETHVPFIGSCGHSLCSVCLNEMKSNENTTCRNPVCRNPEGFVWNKKNELAIKLLTILALRNAQKPTPEPVEEPKDSLPAILDPKNAEVLVKTVNQSEPSDVTDDSILKSSLGNLHLPNSSISKETFEALVLRFAHSTESVDWHLGCQTFDFNPSTLFKEVLPFNHEGRFSEKRPLVFVKENEPCHFYILRKDGKVVHCIKRVEGSAQFDVGPLRIPSLPPECLV